jgi:hypothetical protein
MNGFVFLVSSPRTTLVFILVSMVRRSLNAKCCDSGRKETAREPQKNLTRFHGLHPFDHSTCERVLSCCNNKYLVVNFSVLAKNTVVTEDLGSG